MFFFLFFRISLKVVLTFDQPLTSTNWQPGEGGAVRDPSCSVSERECRGQSSGWMMDEMRQQGWWEGCWWKDVGSIKFRM